ncbi:transketolase [Halobacillus andaensis]|uniref:Transketolase n=1 Tax=Halobacillus andaensis TaxID=1176239 RepID=A0A917ETL1_HALAA|nr:transketolase [Halobacillus andaensis]MBP2003399.1 transketolase [Halobacillus andaensis]GGF10323.1 transketolase [Halobacillus andaensis]
MANSIEQTSINTIRTLAIDAVEKANSGHPGMPMGAAPMAYTLWTQFMNHNPNNSDWFNRDRFVLSAGHGSMLLYSLLHLSGYKVTIDDLKEFRQWDSKTPGHPEYGHTDGVEATTGPLGQGLAMATGMAMAEAHLGAKYNRDQYNVVDHYTFAICGDGDLMEGVSQESASLAGHLGLGKLVVLYDSNDISLDGDLNRSFSESVEKRYEAYGWQVIRVEDGTDTEEIANAIEKAKQNTDQPTMIEVKTVIGYGSPNKSGKSDSHGAPLGEEEVTATKEYYKWGHEPFHVPDEVYEDFSNKVKENGSKKESEWNDLYNEYKQSYPELAEEFELAKEGKLPEGWEENLPSFEPGEDNLATRAASGEVINSLSKAIPYFFGGSADLAGSNKTAVKEEEDFSRHNYAGRNIWFGVREFAMAAALNGMALHGGLKVYAGTFFVFSDYLRPAIRLSALMNLPVNYVLTHDSVAVGEDGPTHEPIEQLSSLRSVPNLSVVRPADGNETSAAWRLALESNTTPNALVLTRQGLPTLDGTKEKAYEGVKRGAYVLVDSDKETPDGILLASGSEVQLAVKAQEELKTKGYDVRVVSVPSFDRFQAQNDEYKESVLPNNVRQRLAIEMGASFGWERYVGLDGAVIGIDRFGASAPGNTIIEKFGFTVDNVVKHAENLMSN